MSALAAVVAAVDPALAGHAVTEPPPGELEAVVGGGDRSFVIEAIREGYLVHYDEPRAFGGMDDDLRLLAGDALFALGLERLAARADLEAVAELSDLISQSAQAQAEGRREDVDALWAAAARRLARSSGEAPESGGSGRP